MMVLLPLRLPRLLGERNFIRVSHSTSKARENRFDDQSLASGVASRIRYAALPFGRDKKSSDRP
jgi:hypothetical protein